MNTCMEDVLHDIRCNTGDEEYSEFIRNLKLVAGDKDSDDLTEDEIKEAWKITVEKGGE